MPRIGIGQSKRRKDMNSHSHSQTFFSLVAAILASTIGFAITLI